MRVVLDAKPVCQRGLGAGGPSGANCGRLASRLAGCPCFSILAEIRRVLLYPRLQRRHGWDEARVDAFLEGLLVTAILTPSDTDIQDVPDDPSNNKYLACALEGNAEYIITGDQHLLRLDPWRGIQIVPPAVFLDIALKGEQ